MENDDGVRLGLKGLMTVSSLVSLSVGFVVSYMVGMSEVRVLQERMSNLQTGLNELSVDRYRGVDADRDQVRLELLIGNNAKHIEELERLLREHTGKPNAHRNGNTP